MAIKIYNTLTRKKEEFKPIVKNQVGIYSCGPTVYSYAHIGNLRTYVFNDILKRVFLYNKYRIKHVMNMTDVDDKTIKSSKQENIELKELTRKYEKIFLKDLEKLNIIKPDIISRATEHINEMVELIKILLKKGYAYNAEDGIYFSVSKFKDYGKLANLEKTKIGKARIKNDEYDKENIQDFALWKFWTESDGDIFWNAEIGKGRPGWHIECSAMSTKYLGKTFDIHTGAIDLMFPHHTNEIAQSEAAFGRKFVNYWIHGGFLTMKEGKMSKSLGNIFRLKDLEEKGYSPLDYRYLTLTSHYRSPLSFSFENLDSAKNSFQRLKRIILEIKYDKEKNEKYLKEFENAINDDLDMPTALSILWRLVRDEKAAGKVGAIREMDKVFGLELLKKEKIEIPSSVMKLIEEREDARKKKDWKRADELREKINNFGWKVDDAKDGGKVSKI